MAVPTDTFETYAAIGNREDLTDVIYNISPTDTPFLSGIEVTDATAVLHEWQIDTLAAAAQNAVIEGDDATTTAVVATSRPSNTCQISDKVPRVTGTQQAVIKGGRGDELEYQIAKMAKELKNDMESDLLRSNAEVTGSSGTARELGGVPTWLTTNLDEAGDATTSTGGGNNERTAGTARAFTEAQLKSVLKQCWDEGGDPDMIMLGSFNKQVASSFTGNATREVSAADRQLFAAIDIYDSDFGELQIVPNRRQPASMAFVFQMDLWATAYLRQFQLHDLAKTGDSERRQLLVEYTLEARNEAGSGAVMDLTTS
jgi:DNA-binding transcriptional regulator YbjK